MRWQPGARVASYVIPPDGRRAAHYRGRTGRRSEDPGDVPRRIRERPRTGAPPARTRSADEERSRIGHTARVSSAASMGTLVGHPDARPRRVGGAGARADPARVRTTGTG